MHGHAVNNPIKVGRVFILRGNRGAPVVATAVDGTWVELLDNRGERRRIETSLLGRAVMLPGYLATPVDLGGEVVTDDPRPGVRTRWIAIRGIARGPARLDLASAQQDLRTFLLVALLNLIAQQEAEGTRPPTSARGTITRQEAASWARMRVQSIDGYRQRGAFTWRMEGGKVAIEAASFELWLVGRLQQREREKGENG